MFFRALLRAAVVLTVAGVVWVGCDPPPCGYADGCSNACSVDGDCEEPGSVCRPVEVFATPEAPLHCTRPCTATTDCLVGTSRHDADICRCAEPEASGFCDSTTSFDGPGARLRERCAADFDRAGTCALLCDCPCSFHGDCPGGDVVAGCNAACTGAYDASPSCQQELDAYYACAQGHAVCAESGRHGITCASGWPFCWSRAPADACSMEAQAVASCAGSVWTFIYPVPL